MAKDLLGQTFGQLTVIQRLRSEPGKGNIWLCRCTCGNLREAATARLTSGHVQSCGCLLRTHAASLNTVNIAGQRFGRLTALSPTELRDASGSIIWACQCECGNTAQVPVNALRSKRVQSCGCLFRESRTQIAAKRRDKLNGTLASSLLRGKKVRSGNQSGYTGVCLNKQTGKWLAYINIRKKRIFLGSFTQLEDAVRARREAERKYHDPLIEAALPQLTDASRQQFQQYLAAMPEQDPH